MQNKLVSVIIPVYNVEAFLGCCIESIMAQTYSNLEIILINDGSTDKSGSICDLYKNKDSRIKVLHKENAGVSSARNAGLNIANGEYIFFLDSDDYIENDAVEKLAINISQYNGDMCIGCTRVVNNDSDILKEHTFPFKESVRTVNELEFWRLFEQSKIIGTVVWSKLYQRELLDGLQFVDGKIHEDEEILHRIVSRCDHIVCINEILFNYRVGNESIMSHEFRIENISKADFLADRLDYFISKGYTELYTKCFGDGAAVLRLAFANLDYKHNEEMKKEIDRVYRRYKNLISMISKDIPGMKMAIKKMVFSSNLFLYDFIAKRI